MNIQRNTIQRQIVLNALKKLNTHPSIEELYSEIKKEHPAISKATVYRNLHHLAKSGVIRQVMLPDGLERYDESTERHYHFSCKNCGRIYDLDVEYLSGINESVENKYGFQIDEHNIIFSGACQKCKLQ